MEEREGFVSDSKTAIKGVLNGIIGNTVYQFIVLMIITMFVSSVVASKNPNVSGEELEALVNQEYEGFPFSILISCLTSFITLIVFGVIIKFETLKQLFVKAFDKQVLKYGAICALCMMGVSIFYNSIVEVVFEIGEGGNANQEGIVDLIKSNAFLGFLAVVVFAPVVEELTYRYCIFGGLLKYKKIVAYLVASLVFMAMHGVSSYTAAGGFNKEFLLELVYLPPYLFSGLALAYVYDKTGNLGSSTLAHLLNNLISFLAIVCL